MFYVVFFLVLDFGGLVLNFGGLVLNFGGLSLSGMYCFTLCLGFVLNFGGLVLNSGGFVLNIGGFWKPLNPYSLVGAFFSLSRAGANQILKAQN